MFGPKPRWAPSALALGVALIVQMLPAPPVTAVAAQVTSAVTVAPTTEKAALTPFGSSLSVVAPQRVMAPRVVAGGTAYTLRLSGVPAGATAVALNLTVAKVAARTFVSACPGGTAVVACRATSTVNAEAGENVANHVVVGLGGAAGDEVMFYVDRGSSTLIADLQGWFTTARRAPLTVDGSSVQVSTSVTSPVVFDIGPLTAGQVIGLNVQLLSGTSAVTFLVRRPDGTAAAVHAYPNGDFAAWTSGEHGLQVEQFSGQGTYVFTASTPFEGPAVTLDGPDVQVLNERPGQLVDLGLVWLPGDQRFNAFVGSGFSARMIGLASDLTPRNHTRTIASGRSGAAGDYPLLLRPTGNSPLSTTLTLSSPVSAPPMTVDGPTVPLPDPRDGQEVVVPLSGQLTKGTELGVYMPSAVGTTQYIELVSSSGTVELEGYSDVVTHTVPADGAYSLRVYGYRTSTLTVTTPRVASPLVVDGDLLDIPELRPGQRTVVPVAPGSADGRVGFFLDVPGYVDASIRRTDGSLVARLADFGADGSTVALAPTADRLVIQLRRLDSGTGAATLLASSPLTRQVEIDGATLVAPDVRPGQEVDVPLRLQAGDVIDVAGPIHTQVLDATREVARSYDSRPITLQPTAATTYTVRLSSIGRWTEPPQLTVSRSLVLGDVHVGAPPVDVPATRLGQRVLLTVPEVQAGVSYLVTLRQEDKDAYVNATATDAQGKDVVRATSRDASGTRFETSPWNVAGALDIVLEPEVHGAVGPGTVDVVTVAS